MKRYSRKQLAKGYLALAAKTSPAAAGQALAAAVVEQKQSHAVELVVREILRQKLLAGEVYVDVATAHAAPVSLKEKIETMISRATGAPKVSALYVVDPELIGGFRVTTPTHEINASVSNILKTL